MSHFLSSDRRLVIRLQAVIVVAGCLLAVVPPLVGQQQPPESPGVTITDEPPLPGIAEPDNTLPFPDLSEPDPTLPSLDGDTSGRTAATQTSTNQRFAPTSFSPQLAASFPMVGDFFGRGSSQITVGELFGIAVHHTTASGSAFADNDLHLINLDPNINGAVFVGGPAGLVPASFLSPSSPPPLPGVVPGLTLNNVPGSVFTAVETTNAVDVYDNPADPNPSIPTATIYNVFQSSTVFITGPNVADRVGRIRIQDNNSAIPRDRIIFDYNFFHNVPLTSTGIDVNRFVPGVEKTFWGGMASVEVRVPMAVTLSSDATLGMSSDTSRYEFGNIVVIPKVLLTSTRNAAIAAGIGISVPTADDVTIFGTAGQRLLGITNESVHLVPYVALTYAPIQSNFFSQAFVTLDVDTNGNSVAANVAGTGLQPIGTWNDQTLLSASCSIGQYLYQNANRSGRLRSLAWSTEVHYTGTVDNAEVLSSGAFNLGTPNGNVSIVNGTAGLHARICNTTATAAYSFPLTSSDRVFDGEFRVFLNRFF